LLLLLFWFLPKQQPRLEPKTSAQLIDQSADFVLACVHWALARREGKKNVFLRTHFP
jgi:hypothetical protein